VVARACAAWRRGGLVCADLRRGEFLQMDGVVVMKAPERIWINYAAANKVDLAYDEPPITPFDDVSQEYVRADIAALEAPDAGVVAELVEAAKAFSVAYRTWSLIPRRFAHEKEAFEQMHLKRNALDDALAKLETRA
jgi:hypothetical protein